MTKKSHKTILTVHPENRKRKDETKLVGPVFKAQAHLDTELVEKKKIYIYIYIYFINK